MRAKLFSFIIQRYSNSFGGKKKNIEESEANELNLYVLYIRRRQEIGVSNLIFRFSNVTMFYLQLENLNPMSFFEYNDVVICFNIEINIQVFCLLKSHDRFKTRLSMSSRRHDTSLRVTFDLLTMKTYVQLQVINCNTAIVYTS